MADIFTNAGFKPLNKPQVKTSQTGPQFQQANPFGSGYTPSFPSAPQSNPLSFAPLPSTPFKGTVNNQFQTPYNPNTANSTAMMADQGSRYMPGTNGPGSGQTVSMNYPTPNFTPNGNTFTSGGQVNNQVASSQVYVPNVPTYSTPQNNVDPYANTPRFDTTTGQPTAYGLSLGLQPLTKVVPQHFSVSGGNSDGTISSDNLHNKTSYDGLMQSHSDAVNGLTSPNNTKVPSDTLLNSIYSQSLYSPEEQAAMQNIATAQSDAYTGQLAQRRKIEQMQSNGDITQDQAKAMIEDTVRRTDRQIADATGNQSFFTNQLGVLGQVRGNSLTALQNYYNNIKGSQVLSPGQTFVNAQGETVSGAPGVAPQITALATQLYSQASTNGTLATDQNGQPDMNYYMQQASQLTGIPLNSGSSAGQAYSGGQSQSGMGQGGQTANGGAYGSQGYGNINMIAPALRQYVQPITLGSQDISYIDLTRVPQGIQNTVKSQAQAAGIPTFDEAGVGAIASANTILSVIESAKLLAQKELSGGTWGRMSAIAKSKLNDWFQTNPELASFNNLRETAAKTVTALGGGVGSGLRMNLPMIDTAVNNMPTSQDNYETAIKKANNVQNLILEGLSTKFPQFKQGDIFGAGGSQTQSSGGGAVKTKAGVINTNW